MTRNKKIIVKCVGRGGNEEIKPILGELLEKYEPNLVILHGIAAGVRERVEIKDLVISNQIYDLRQDLHDIHIWSHAFEAMQATWLLLLAQIANCNSPAERSSIGSILSFENTFFHPLCSFSMKYIRLSPICQAKRLNSLYRLSKNDQLAGRQERRQVRPPAR